MAERDSEYQRGEEDDENDEVDENNYKTQKDAILLAIEVSDSMLQPPPASDSKKADTDSALAAALKCAYHLMQQRIISNPKDMMGILLYGTQKSKFQSEADFRGGIAYPHCYLYIDLDIPAAEDVQLLKSLVEEGEDKDGILSPASEGVSMANVLFCANQIFTTKAANFGSRRLFVISDNDDPHQNDKTAKSAAAVRAKDLFDLGVVIELFPITRNDGKFDIGKFYDDIIYRDPAIEANLSETRTSRSGDGLTLLKSLISNINSKQTAKRALFSGVPFEIAPDLTISVKGFNVLQRQEPVRSCYVWLEGETPQIATSETVKLAQESTRTVEKAEIKKAYKFGGEYIYFTPEEQKSLKNFGSPVIRILGFKPRSTLKFWMSVKKASFLFPSEEHYVGSTRVFAALWQKLLKDGKIGVAWAITRANAKPGLFALIPSRERSDTESGTPYMPAGLWMFPLPFMDDLRNPPEVPKPEKASPQLTDTMKQIIGNLWLPNRMYDPSKYPNPQLQWHYKILQALALSEEVPETPEDATCPRYKSIAKRVGKYISEWAERLDEEASLVKQTRNLKREAEDDDGRASKRSKTSTDKAAASGLSTSQLKAAADSGGLEKMTVAQLRDVLTIRGLNPQGRKAELIEKLESWLDSNA